MRRFTIGTISHGTLRAEDLIPAFAKELRRFKPLPLALSRAVAAFNRNPEDNEDAQAIVDDLADELSALAPSCCYFGSHEGDGSDFGFWVSHDALQEFDGLRVSDLSEVPADYRGEVLHVNDHGNATLYVQTSRTRLLEVWSIV